MTIVIVVFIAAVIVGNYYNEKKLVRARILERLDNI